MQNTTWKLVFSLVSKNFQIYSSVMFLPNALLAFFSQATTTPALASLSNKFGIYPAASKLFTSSRNEG